MPINATNRLGQREVAPPNEHPMTSSALIDEIAHERQAYHLPPVLGRVAAAFIDQAMRFLFVQHAGEAQSDRGAVDADATHLRRLLEEALGEAGAGGRREVAESFFSQLPLVRATLLTDAQALLDGDPAAHSIDEVILAYPGFAAIAVQRIAHALNDLGVTIFPRLLTEHAHRATGIDIHPGARIGPSFAIDHGTGVVIGETAVIGTRVKLYQGVTLGALSVSKRLQSTKRHPTVGDDVVVYANATILGGETLVGRGSIIGGNVWLTRSVPPFSVVTPTARIDQRSHNGDDGVLEFNI